MKEEVLQTHNQRNASTNCSSSHVEEEEKKKKKKKKLTHPVSVHHFPPPSSSSRLGKATHNFFFLKRYGKEEDVWPCAENLQGCFLPPSLLPSSLLGCRIIRNLCLRKPTNQPSSVQQFLYLLLPSSSCYRVSQAADLKHRFFV